MFEFYKSSLALSLFFNSCISFCKPGLLFRGLQSPTQFVWMLQKQSNGLSKWSRTPSPIVRASKIFFCTLGSAIEAPCRAKSSWTFLGFPVESLITPGSFSQCVSTYSFWVLESHKTWIASNKWFATWKFSSKLFPIISIISDSKHYQTKFRESIRLWISYRMWGRYTSETFPV